MVQNIFIFGPFSPPEPSVLAIAVCCEFFYIFYFKQMVSVSDRVLPYTWKLGQLLVTYKKKLDLLHFSITAAAYGHNVLSSVHMPLA